MALPAEARAISLSILLKISACMEFSFQTDVGGASVAGELSYRPKHALQINSGDMSRAALAEVLPAGDNTHVTLLMFRWATEIQHEAQRNSGRPSVSADCTSIDAGHGCTAVFL